MFCKKAILRKFAKLTEKHLCQSPFFNKVAGLRPETLLKKTLAQVLSCEFCEIPKNTFSYKTPSVAASAQQTFTFSKSIVETQGKAPIFFILSKKADDSPMISALLILTRKKKN